MEKQPSANNSTCLPKKYPRRPGSDDSGRDYEVKIAALLALRCAAMDNVKDLWLGSNVDQVGDFDDIVLLLKTSEGNRAYMIQLKHQDNPKDINPTDFTYVAAKTRKRKKSKEDFSLAKYSVGFEDLKRRLREPQEDEAEIIRCLRSAHIFLVLFTNKGLSPCDLLEAVCDETLRFLNTSSNDNVHRFRSGQLDYDQDFLRQLVLLSNQIHINDVDGLIQNEIKRLAGNSNLARSELKDFGDKFVAFVRVWAKGAGNSSKTHFAFTKADVINVISDILLDPYKLDFSKDHFSYYDDSHSMVWNQILCDKVVTVVDYEATALEFLKQYVGSEVRQLCNKSGKTWAHSISRNLFCKDPSVVNPIIGSSNAKITLHNIYKCLWFATQLPLLLRIRQAQDHSNITRILKLSNHSLSVLLLKDQNLQLAIKKERAIKYFVDINDLSVEDRATVLNMSVKLQGRSSIMLQSLVDKDAHQFIKSGDIIKILLHDFTVGPQHAPLLEYLIQRTLSTVLLRKDVIQHVPNEVFLVENVPVARLNDFNRENCHISDGTFQQIEELKRLGKTIHQLSFHDENDLKWRRSLGSIQHIRPYKSKQEAWCPLEEVFGSNVHLISAGPGMGKSTSMDLIAHAARSDTWVLKVNLNDHDEYYESRSIKTAKASDHLNYFNGAVLEEDRNANLSKAAFQKLLDLKQVLVLLDGFDEICITYKEEVTDMVKCLYEEGFAMVLTTRPVMEAHLEETFNTISVTLKPFTEHDQESFMVKYFSPLGAVEHQRVVKGFARKLLRAAKVNLNDRDCQFTGVPLQTKLLADVFSADCKASIERDVIELREQFDLLYLYDRFLKSKIDILCGKFGKGVKQMRLLFEKHQQLFALKILFPKSDLEGLNIDEELDEYYRDDQCKLQLLQREGVLVAHKSTDTKFSVRFAHRTFAEYTAAQWLAQNVNNKGVATTVEKLTTRRLPPHRLNSFLFDMFDRLVATECPLHSAVLNERLDEIEETIDSCLSTVDAAGRSVLHLMALRGVYHPYHAFYNNLGKTKDKMVELLDLIPDDSAIDSIVDNVLGWNALDYAIASYSLAVADRLCQKFPTLNLTVTLDVSTKEEYFSYCTWLRYKALSKVLLPHFTIKFLLLPFLTKTMDVQTVYEEHGPRVSNDFFAEVIAELAFAQHFYGDLHCAAAFGTKQNVQCLLEKGADINRRDFQDCSPLHYAAVRRRPDIASLLLEKRANVDQPGRHHNTALHYAAEAGADDIVSELIDRGANVDCLNTNDDTPLHSALLGGHKDTVKLLLSKGASGNVANAHEDSILHRAAESGFDDVLTELLDRGEDVNQVNCTDEQPLHLAIKECHMGTVKLLLRRGASVKTPEGGESPLHYAALTDSNEIVEELLTRGANIDELNRDGDPPLHYALRKGQTGMAAFLLSKGARRNTTNNKGVSTLHYAAKAGGEAIVLKLLSEGADLNKVDHNGNPPLHFAFKRERFATARLLLSKGAESVLENRQGSSTVHLAAEAGDLGSVSTLLSQGAQADTKDLHGNTPLHLAARQHLAIAELLANPTTINVQNNRGKTPLHISIADHRQYSEEGCEEQKLLVRLLLDRGADVNAKDSGGNSPLHSACADHFTKLAYLISKTTKMTFYEDTVSLLLSRGAKATVKNEQGKTPLDLAMEAEYTGIVDLLRQSVSD